MEHPGDGQVVDVVAGRYGALTLLTPPGHSSVDQARIQAQAFLRPRPQPLHHSRPETFYEHIGRLDQVEKHLQTLRSLEI